MTLAILGLVDYDPTVISPMNMFAALSPTARYSAYEPEVGLEIGDRKL